jgi:hypothetical protein
LSEFEGCYPADTSAEPCLNFRELLFVSISISTALLVSRKPAIRLIPEKLADTKLHLHTVKHVEAIVIQGVHVKLCGASNCNDRHALTSSAQKESLLSVGYV